MINNVIEYYWNNSELEPKYIKLALDLEEIKDKWENQYKQKYIKKYGKIDYVIYPRRKNNAMRSNKVMNEIKKSLYLLNKAVMSKKLYNLTGNIDTLQGFKLDKFTK